MGDAHLEEGDTTQYYRLDDGDSEVGGDSARIDTPVTQRVSATTHHQSFSAVRILVWYMLSRSQLKVG